MVLEGRNVTFDLEIEVLGQPVGREVAEVEMQAEHSEVLSNDRTLTTQSRT